MKLEQLKEVVKEKNAARERQTLRDAEALIEQIADEQRSINTHYTTAGERIAELRKELKALAVDTLDSTSILGE